MENQKLSITLTVPQWNVVIQALGDRPFAQVANLIQEIKAQADSELSRIQAETIPGSEING